MSTHPAAFAHSVTPPRRWYEPPRPYAASTTATSHPLASSAPPMVVSTRSTASQPQQAQGDFHWQDDEEDTSAPLGPDQKRRRNASAQADFRRRRKDYLNQLEHSYQESLNLVQHLNELHRKAAEETRLYRERNLNLDATVAELRAELEQAKRDLEVARAASPVLIRPVSPVLQPETALVFGHDTYSHREPASDFAPAELIDPCAISVDHLGPPPIQYDTFTLYAEADAPLRPNLFAPTPVHYPSMGLAFPGVSAGSLPALTYSPESAVDDLPPITPISATRTQTPSPMADGVFGKRHPHSLTLAADYLDGPFAPGPNAAPTAATLPVAAPSLAPSAVSVHRPNSLPTRSAKCTAQLALMRKLVRDAEVDRLHLALGVAAVPEEPEGDAGGREGKRRRTSV